MEHSSTHSMYYVAVVCPPEVDEKVVAFKKRMKEQFGCVVALKSPAHITLVPPFWFEDVRENELMQAVESFKCEVKEVEVELDGFSHFNKRVLFAVVRENPSLEILKERVEDHFVQAFSDSIKREERPFHPHITIANRDLKPGDFVKAWEYFSKKEFKETFRSGIISLLKLSPGKWNVIGMSH